MSAPFTLTAPDASTATGLLRIRHLPPVPCPASGARRGSGNTPASARYHPHVSKMRLHDRIPLDVLQELLSRHGIDAPVEGDWLRLPRGCRCAARFIQLQSDGAIQLDVAFEPWQGALVLESCAGFGERRAEQEADAWRRFAAGSLHVLLAAFLYDEAVPVERTAWEIDGLTRAVTISDALTRGEPPDLAPWRNAIRSAIMGSTLPEGTHWIRVFVAQLQGTLTTEVLLDNEPWEYAAEQLAGFIWPVGGDYYSVRYFLVVQGGIDVSRAIADLVAHLDADDDQLVELMQARGVDARDADCLVALIPLAFGRLLLERLQVPLCPDVVFVSRAGMSQKTCRLLDEPIYCEAIWLAERATLTRDQSSSIARRSPEVKAVEAMIEQGQAPGRLVLSSPHVSVP